MIKKLKTVKVQTPKGTVELQFRPGERFLNQSQDETISICDLDCPYAKICGHLPDPEYPDELKFNDLCTRIGDVAETQEDMDIKYYHPVEGTIENELGEIFPEILEVIKEKNPLFRLDTIIDRICPGMCEDYNREHTNCGKKNILCILTDLFIGPQKEADGPVKLYETDRVEEDPLLDSVEDFDSPLQE